MGIDIRTFYTKSILICKQLFSWNKPESTPVYGQKPLSTILMELYFKSSNKFGSYLSFIMLISWREAIKFCKRSVIIIKYSYLYRILRHTGLPTPDPFFFFSPCHFWHKVVFLEIQHQTYSNQGEGTLTMPDSWYFVVPQADWPWDQEIFLGLFQLKMGT